MMSWQTWNFRRPRNDERYYRTYMEYAKLIPSIFTFAVFKNATDKGRTKHTDFAEFVVTDSRFNTHKLSVLTVYGVIDPIIKDGVPHYKFVINENHPKTKMDCGLMTIADFKDLWIGVN